jgi:hypothetical protein
MTNKITSWIKGRSDHPSDTYTTDEDRIAGLDDSMDIDALDADADMYRKKYLQLRKHINEDKIYKDLRTKNALLQEFNHELEAKLVDVGNLKLGVEVQLIRREKELKDVEAHHKTERGAANARNEALKLENKMLRKNEEYMKFLLASHGIQTPALISPPQSGPPTPELTDESDMDEADEPEDPPTVCPEWYNSGKCSLGDGTRSNKCKRGTHPRLVRFKEPLGS